MSRFANPNAVERIVLGPCECPGTPHDEDWMELRSEFGAQDLIDIAEGDDLKALEVIVRKWNLLDFDGSEAPVDRPHLERLFDDNFARLDGWVQKHVRTKTTLPNGSGAPSRNGSQGSAHLTRPIRARR